MALQRGFGRRYVQRPGRNVGGGIWPPIFFVQSTDLAAKQRDRVASRLLRNAKKSPQLTQMTQFSRIGRPLPSVNFAGRRGSRCQGLVRSSNYYRYHNMDIAIRRRAGRRALKVGF
jgi:hypothetical protein